MKSVLGCQTMHLDLIFPRLSPFHQLVYLIPGSNCRHSDCTKQFCCLGFDSYLRGFLSGPGWWWPEAAPAGCTWWWWMVCWGWCCCLSCRVKGTVSCCNTERTAPDRRPDNCGSPVVRDGWYISGQKNRTLWALKWILKLKAKDRKVIEEL